LDECLEQIDAVFCGGGEVGTQVAEVFGAGESTHGAGDLLPDFNHADYPFSGVVIERASPWVIGETQVVIYAFEHPVGQRMQLLIDRGELTGVVLDPDQRGVPERGGTGGENVRRDVVLADGDGRLGGGFQGQQRSDALFGPGRGRVEFTCGDQFAEQMRAAQRVRRVRVAVIQRPRVMHRDPGEPGQQLTVTRIGKPSHGTAVLSSDGIVTYAPAKGCAGGADLFTCTVRSSKGGTDTATVTLTVNGAPAVSQPAASRLPKTGTDITSAARADILALLGQRRPVRLRPAWRRPAGRPVVAGGMLRRRGPGRPRPGRHRDDHHRR
jgi:hypothetical protein